MEKQRMLKNALTMTGISLLLRLAGVWTRAAMAQRIGAEGVGLHQLLLSAFWFAVTFSTAGISTAVTRLISEDLSLPPARQAGESRILRAGLRYALCLGAVAALAMGFGADWIGATLLGDVRTVRSLRILAPALPLMAAAACFKGLFVARREAFVPSLGDLLEQGTETVVFLAVIELFRGRDLSWQCAAVAVGTLTSELASCAFMAVRYWRDRGKPDGVAGGTGDISPSKKLLAIAVPVSASACLGAALRAVENVMIPSGLQASGMTEAAALSAFGMVRGMALPMMFLPAAFLSACSLLMVPEIAQARVRGGDHALNGPIRRVLQMTFLLSILTAAVFLVFWRELGLAVYGSGQVGAITLLLTPLLPLMYVDAAADGMLKGLDRQLTVLKYNIADSVLRIALIAALIPRLGVPGFLAMMYVSNILNPVLSLRKILRVTGMRMEWGRWILRPVTGALAASAVCRLAMELAPAFFRTPAGLCMGVAGLCALCVAALRVCGGLTDGDLRWARRSLSPLLRRSRALR